MSKKSFLMLTLLLAGFSRFGYAEEPIAEVQDIEGIETVEAVEAAQGKSAVELPQWVKNIKFSGYGMLQYQGVDKEGAHSNSFNLRLARFILDGKIGDFDWRAHIQGTNATGTVESDVDGVALAVKAAVADANIKLAYNSAGYAQFNKDTEIDVPVNNAGDIVTVVSYPGQSNYTVGGEDAIGQNTFAYTAKSSDASKGYVAVVATATAYLYSIKVEQKTPQGPATLDDEPATATFPFHDGTDGQTATFSEAGYFLTSKVAYGSNLSLDGKDNKGHEQTWFGVAAKESSAAESNAIRFLITPKPGLMFTATKVSFKATRYGTNGGKMDFSWQNADGTTVKLDTEKLANRDNDPNPVSEFSYTISHGWRRCQWPAHQSLQPRPREARRLL